MPKKDPNRHEFQELVIMEHLLKNDTALRKQLAIEIENEETRISLLRAPKKSSYHTSIIQRILDRMIDDGKICINKNGRYELTNYGLTFIQVRLELQKKIQKAHTIKNITIDKFDFYHHFMEDLLGITFMIRDKELVDNFANIEGDMDLLKQKMESVISSMDMTLKVDQHDDYEELRKMIYPGIMKELEHLKEDNKNLRKELFSLNQEYKFCKDKK